MSVLSWLQRIFSWEWKTFEQGMEDEKPGAVWVSWYIEGSKAPTKLEHCCRVIIPNH